MLAVSAGMIVVVPAVDSASNVTLQDERQGNQSHADALLFPTDKMDLSSTPAKWFGAKSIVAVALLLGLIALAVHARSARDVEVVFMAQVDAPGRLQLFHDADGRFSEPASQWIHLPAGAPLAEATEIDGRGAAQLRFDPPNGATTTLCGLRVGRAGLRGQYEVRSFHDVKLVRNADCLMLLTGRDARDPQVTLAFVGSSLQAIKRAGAWQVVYRIAEGAILLLLWWLLRSWTTAARSLPDGVSSPRWLEATDRNAHWLGALLMLLLGSAYVVGTPPGAVPDEPAHLAKIIRIAYGAPFGGSGQELLPGLGDIYGPFQGYLHNKAAFTKDQLDAQLHAPLHCERVTSSLPRQADGYSPIPYLLPTMAFKATCAAGGSVGAFLYWARMLNLLAATLLVAFAVRHAAVGKWALFTVALLPMSLFQMASLSVDALTMALGMAWLGLVSGIAGGKLAPARAVPMLWTLSLAVALSKAGAIWILPSLLFCKRAFENTDRSIVPAMLQFVALPFFVHAVWLLATAGQAAPLTGVDAAVNAASLRTDPRIFMHAWLNTFFGAQMMALARMLVGSLGWLDVYLSPWVYPVSGVALLASLRADGPPQLARPHWVVPLALAFAVASLVMIALPLFVFWSPAGLGYVQGLQGRYFIITVAWVLVWCAWPSSARVRALLIPAIVVVVAAINLDALNMLHRAYFIVGR